MTPTKNPKVLLYLESSREFGRKLLRGIVNYAGTHSSWVVIFETEWTQHLLAKRIREADGIIAHIHNTATMNIISKSRVPVVAATYSNNAQAVRCSINADSAAIGKMAAEHFLSRGFINFGYCGHGNVWYSKEREQAFVKSVKEFCFAEPSVYYDKRQKTKSTELESIGQWALSLQKPCGVFACNDDLAEKVLEACKMENIKVPDEIAVLGVDNDEFICNLTRPPLSSIGINGEEAGYEAAAILDKIMQNKKLKVPDVTLVPTHVVVRQSTDTMAVKDKEVYDSLRYVADHCDQPIAVNDVVYAATCSRRVLERKFRQIIGKSIREQIQDMRTERIARMLLETDLNVSQITYQMGFSRVDHVCRYFRRRYNMSPGDYRQKYRKNRHS